MANYGFIIDNRRCIGCHACTVACKSEHNVPVGVNRTWVKYIEKGEFPNSRRLFSVMRCNHCDNAPCVTICPVTALYQRDDGIVDFDNRRCIGCKACMQACPYDALYIDPNTHTAAKCNYCAHRVDQGLEPACVNICPTQAIISGDLDNPESRISQLKSREPVSARKTEKGTLPALYYINGDSSSLDPHGAPDISETMWGSQVEGVGHHAEHGNHPLDYLGSLLGLGEKPATRSPGAVESHAETTSETPRRAYDAPQKGILWGWQVTSYLWTKAIAAGVVLIFMLIWNFMNPETYLEPKFHIAMSLVSLIFLGLTGILLILDLDQPKRFLYVMLRPQWNSWLVRGAYIITAFSGLLTAYLALVWVQQDNFIDYSIVAVVMNACLAILAVLTGIYTAFLFAQAKGRDAWQSPMLPVQMLTHTAMCGLAVWTLLFPVMGFTNSADQTILARAFIVLIVFHLICEFSHMFLTHATDAAHQAARMTFSGRYKTHYWLGVILVGSLIPLGLLAFAGTGFGIAAAILVLAGVFISQHISVFAPQQLPLS